MQHANIHIINNRVRHVIPKMFTIQQHITSALQVLHKISFLPEQPQQLHSMCSLSHTHTERGGYELLNHQKDRQTDKQTTVSQWSGCYIVYADVVYTNH